MRLASRPAGGRPASAHSVPLRPLAALVAAIAPAVLALGASQAQAQAQTSELKEVVVTATRQEADPDLIPATITSIDRKTLDRRMPHDEAALMENEADVVISRDLRRYGSAAVNIRGIEGIRVLQQVDGVRLPDYYYGGGPSNITASMPDGPEMDFLKRAEILRGPASSLYGSDALGGVVGYLTLDPQDLLQGRSSALRYKGTWRQADHSFQNTVYAAGGNDRVEGLLAYSQRNGKELDNKGNVGGTGYNREQPNPQDTKSDSVLAKIILKPATGHRISLTYENREQDNHVDSLRLSIGVPKVTQTYGDENTRRERYGIDWEWKPTDRWFDRLALKFYHQEADSKTYTMQRRSNTSASCSASSGTGNTCLVDMNFMFNQKTDGLNLQLDSYFQTGAVSHSLAYGADWRQTRTEELRDYTVHNLTTGTTGKTLAGDTYPLKDFAPGESTNLGLFVQDELSFMDGKFLLTPGVRYDEVKLRPDGMSKVAGSGGSAVTLNSASQNHSAVSPKIGTLWQASPAVALYGQLVRGFRAPNYEEVNGLFYNSAQGYTTLPNGNLKAEKSTGLELGTRLKALGGDIKVAVYDNRYDDFIEQVQVCNDTAAPFTCPGGTRSAYQKLNLSKVRIQGAEVRGSWLFAGGYAFQGSIATARGDDEQNNRPLNSIEPLRAVLSFLWDKGQWGGETRLRLAAAKERINDADTDYYKPAGYGVMDVSTWWQVDKRFRLTAAVNNVFDKQYTLWSDVRHAGLLSTDPGPSFFTQPGRNVSLSLQADF
jgi:hemoglobin/transferrin/lactoferrin receptor protein